MQHRIRTEPPPPRSVPEVLDRAADLIATRGLLRHEQWTDQHANGAMGAGTAVCVAVTGRVNVTPLPDLVIDAIAECSLVLDGDLDEWADNAADGWADVATLMRYTAQTLRDVEDQEAEETATAPAPAPVPVVAAEVVRPGEHGGWPTLTQYAEHRRRARACRPARGDVAAGDRSGFVALLTVVAARRHPDVCVDEFTKAIDYLNRAAERFPATPLDVAIEALRENHLTTAAGLIEAHLTRRKAWMTVGEAADFLTLRALHGAGSTRKDSK